MDFKLVLAHDIDKLSDDVATYIEHLYRYVDIYFFVSWRRIVKNYAVTDFL